MFVDEAVNRLHELEHIQIGGTNLIDATALKKNMDAIGRWSINNGNDSTKANINIADTELTPNVNRCWYFDVKDSTNYYGITQDISNRLMKNTTYTLSFWIMPTADNVGQTIPFVYYKDDDGNATYHSCSYKNSELKFYKWNKITYTFTTKSNMNPSYVAFSCSSQKCTWKGCFGDFKLELGSHYTDWSPNPHDLVLWDNPIGSVKIMGSDVKPADTIGGAWVQTCQGRNPIGVGTTKDVNNVSKTFQLGATGGEFAHTQTKDELVPHSHGQKVIADNASGTIGNYRADYSSDGRNVGIYPQNVETYETGGGKAMNIVSPFQAFYFWIRTA